MKYDELVTKLYKEPEDGKFEDVTDELQTPIHEEEEEQDQ